MAPVTFFRSTSSNVFGQVSGKSVFAAALFPRPPQGHHHSLGKIYEKMFGIRQSLPTMSECASSINCGLNFYNKKTFL